MNLSRTGAIMARAAVRALAIRHHAKTHDYLPLDDRRYQLAKGFRHI
jgi:hypothetical protein